jgi:putative phosphoribosyl transferase
VSSRMRESPVIIPPVGLEGDLVLPDGARAIVVFAHGSGSSRFSSRNRHVASVLNGAGLGTLLIDLLTAGEEPVDVRTSHLRFDIGLLAGRLLDAVGWLRKEPGTSTLAIGLFGASTGGGAALVAAAEWPNDIAAVVSRGGRPDLAGPSLSRVQAPTLLIVGGNDEPVIEMNEKAYEQMVCTRRLEIVPGATHLFEESGTLDTVARLAAEWFVKHLSRTSA